MHGVLQTLLCRKEVLLHTVRVVTPSLPFRRTFLLRDGGGCYINPSTRCNNNVIPTHTLHNPHTITTQYLHINHAIRTQYHHTMITQRLQNENAIIIHE